MEIILNHSSHTAETPQGNVYLTPKEFGILDYLISHTNECLSAEEIYTYVWEAEPFDCRGVIAVHIRHIREKIEHNPSHPVYLMKKWGKGYQFSGMRDR